MKPLETYLTRAGWRDDLNETIDHLVDSGRSSQQLSTSAAIRIGSMIGVFAIDNLLFRYGEEYIGYIFSGVGLATILGIQGVLYYEAYDRKKLQEKKTILGSRDGFR